MEINVSMFDTSKVTKMDNLFREMEFLEYIDISNFNLENVINTVSMFQDCINLIEIKFKNDTLTNNLEDMNSMFKECNSLEEINTNIS